MPKSQHNVPLAGYTADGKKANTQQADKVVVFWSADFTFKVRNSASKGLVLTTAKGSYKLTPHMSIANKWTCRTNTNIICHFSKKKLVAKLIYWA